MMIFRNSIRNGTKILLSVTQIPSDEILESMYKLRIRESEKLKTVLVLYNMEFHQKKIGPDNHSLKAVVKRSIEQDGQGDGVSKACPEQAAADSRGSRTCVCAVTFFLDQGGSQGRRMN